MDLTIGVVAPFSGGEAVVAQPMLAAVRAAVQAVGPVFGGQVAVRALDDARDEARALAHVQACIEDPDVIGIVGPKNSGSVLAVCETACAAGLPLLLPAATADALAGPGTTLRLCAPDSATAEAAARLARHLSLEGLWVEADGTAYGRELAMAVRRAAKAVDLTLAPHAQGSDAAFLAMGEVEQAARMRELRDTGFQGTFIGAEGGPGAPIGALVGDAAEGAWQLYPGTRAAGHQRVYTAEAAAATRALLRAHDAVGDRTEIATWLRRRDREAITSELGPLWFDADGERDGAKVTLWQVVGGRTIPVNDTPRAR